MIDRILLYFLKPKPSNNLPKKFDGQASLEKLFRDGDFASSLTNPDMNEIRRDSDPENPQNDIDFLKNGSSDSNGGPSPS